MSKVKKSDIFFKVGETYPVFFRTKGLKEFKCTEIDLTKNMVKGSIDGVEKSYKATPVWESVADQKEGKAPNTFAITVDNRTKTRCVAKN